MTDAHDLRRLLEQWPYNPDEPGSNYRVQTREDGSRYLQVREPLGIQQLEYEGRPDGFRPHGKETWLAYYEDLARDRPFFQLLAEDNQKLMQEGVLFYQRYLLLYQMEDWTGVARDTDRNLRYFEFLKRYARDQEQCLVVEQYRPYVLRMNAIAKARLLEAGARNHEALELLEQTVKKIEKLESVPTQVFAMEKERSVKHLGELIQEFRDKRPETLFERLMREQREAIQSEQFERAAILRDEIRRLKKQEED
jgi:hypothetical protein